MKSRLGRAIWIGALVAVLFLPVLIFVFSGLSYENSVLNRLTTLTGLQATGLVVYTVALATRFRAKNSEFGVPLHKYSALFLVLIVICHVTFAIADNPWVSRYFLILDAPAQGAAGVGAATFLLCAIALGEYRKQSKLSISRWRLAHVAVSVLSLFFIFTHILWINRLVYDPVWLLLFSLILLSLVYVWFTRPKAVSKTTDGVVPRIVRWTFVLAALIAIAVTLVSWRSPQITTVGYVPNNLGPISSSDRDMLYKVKQAGLWEMPVGQEAATRGATEELRDIGRKISDEHHELDAKVDAVANQLGIELPTEPSPDQQSWMKEITAAQGLEYDQKAVFYMRQAHGRVLPLLSEVRSGTRNALVREFAAEGMEYVSRHMNYLESTNLVDYAQLPEAPSPSPYQQPAVASYFDTHDPRTLIMGGITILVLAGLAGLITTSILRSTPKQAVAKQGSGAHRGDKK